MDLAGFLAARLDEKESNARCVHDELDCRTYGPLPLPCNCLVPARVLREAEAGRKILARYGEMPAGLGLGEQLQWSQEQQGLLFALEHLAAVYRDHPDYDPAWAAIASPLP